MATTNTLIARLLSAFQQQIASVYDPELTSSYARSLAHSSRAVLASLDSTSAKVVESEKSALSELKRCLLAFKSSISTSKLRNSLEKLLNELDTYSSFSDTQFDRHNIVKLAQCEGSDSNREFILELVKIEQSYLKQKITHCESVLNKGAGTVADSFSVEQRKKLQDFLSEEIFAEQSVSITKIREIAGGFSKQTIILELEGVTASSANLVLRVDRADSPGDASVKNEFGLLEVLYKQGIPVPQPLALEPTSAVIGAPFIVMPFVEGDTPGDSLDVESSSKELALEIAGAMAKLHSLDIKVFRDVIDTRGSTVEKISKDIESFEGRWRGLSVSSSTLEVAFQWLKSNNQLADGDRRMLHQDVGCHNLLVSDGHLTAILDWELSCIGNPAQDLAYAYSTIIQMCDWDAFYDAYLSAGGVAVEEEQIVFYRVWTYTWLRVMQFEAQAAFEQGVTEDIRLAYAATYWASRMEEQLLQELVQALS